MTYDLILSDDFQHQNTLQKKVDKLSQQKRKSIQNIDPHVIQYQQQNMIPTPTTLYAEAKFRDVHTSRRDPHKKSNIQRYNQHSSKNRSNGQVDRSLQLGKENLELRLKNYTRDVITTPLSHN